MFFVKISLVCLLSCRFVQRDPHIIPLLFQAQRHGDYLLHFAGGRSECSGIFVTCQRILQRFLDLHFLFRDGIMSIFSAQGECALKSRSLPRTNLLTVSPLLFACLLQTGVGATFTREVNPWICIEPQNQFGVECLSQLVAFLVTETTNMRCDRPIGFPGS